MAADLDPAQIEAGTAAALEQIPGIGPGRAAERMYFRMGWDARSRAALTAAAQVQHGPDCIPAPFGDCLDHPAQPAPRTVSRCCDSDELRIDSGWLVEVHNHCTIGCEPVYGHQPGCGLVPLVQLDRLDGWPA